MFEKESCDYAMRMRAVEMKNTDIIDSCT